MAYDMGNFAADFNYMRGFANYYTQKLLSSWYSKYIGPSIIETTRTLSITAKDVGQPVSQAVAQKFILSQFGKLASKFVPLSDTAQLVGAKEELTQILTSASMGVTWPSSWNRRGK